MQEERILKMLYGIFKASLKKNKEKCPDMVTLSAFKDGLLPEKVRKKVLAHLLACDHCSENVLLDASIQEIEKEMPVSLLEKAKALVSQKEQLDILEVVVALKEKFLELLEAKVDKYILPAPLALRSPSQKEKSDEINLIKYFKQIKVCLNIKKINSEQVRVSLLLSEKKKEKPLSSLRVSLYKQDQEIESYISQEGKVVFDGLVLGKYFLEISSAKNKLARIALTLK